MTKPPYPGYPPQFRRVDKTGGYDRTCLVIELISDGRLEPAQLAHLQEQMEALLAKFAHLEKYQVVTPDQFDGLLRDGLRVS